MSLSIATLTVAKLPPPGIVNGRRRRICEFDRPQRVYSAAQERASNITGFKNPNAAFPADQPESSNPRSLEACWRSTLAEDQIR